MEKASSLISPEAVHLSDSFFVTLGLRGLGCLPWGHGSLGQLSATSKWLTVTG